MEMTSGNIARIAKTLYYLQIVTVFLQRVINLPRPAAEQRSLVV